MKKNTMLVSPSLPLPKEKVGGRICMASLRVLGRVASIRGIQLFYSSGDFGKRSCGGAR